MSGEEAAARVERFLSAFNDADKYIRAAAGGHGSFGRAVRAYAARHRYWTDAEDLLVLAELRNFIVHNVDDRLGYVALPTEEALRRMEEIRDSLLDPERVFPRYRRKVVTLSPDAPLTEALRIMRSESFSQIPVYGREGFAGLLTENGVVRWLALRIGEGCTADLSKARVGEVLKEEEEMEKLAFCGRGTRLDEVVYLFSEQPALEAVLITEHGRKGEKPLGMMTRYDVLELKGACGR